MKTLAAVVGLVPLLSFAGFPPAWRQVESGTTEELRAVAALNETTAVAVGGRGTSTILRSTDAGETWTPIEIECGLTLTALSFPDELHGFAGAYDTSSQSGLVLRTEDGCLTWTSQPHTFVPGAIHFVDACTGMMVADGAFFRTDDCGQSWRQQFLPTSGYALSVNFTDTQHGSVAGYRTTRSGFIVTTFDGGESWSQQPAGSHLAIAYADPLRGFAGGRFADATSDGGRIWSPLPELSGYFLHSIAFTPDGERGAAVGWGNAAFWTGDGGQSWTRQTPAFALNSVAFFSPEKAVAVGLYGIVVVAP